VKRFSVLWFRVLDREIVVRIPDVDILVSSSESLDCLGVWKELLNRVLRGDDELGELTRDGSALDLQDAGLMVSPEL